MDLKGETVYFGLQFLRGYIMVGRLGGRNITGCYITVVVKKQREKRKWSPRYETVMVPPEPGFRS